MRAREAISPSKTAAANTTRLVELPGRQRLSSGLTQTGSVASSTPLSPVRAELGRCFAAEGHDTRNAPFMSALEADGKRGVGAARLVCLFAAACALALVWSAAPAAAGGTDLAVVAVAGDVWLTTGLDVVKLDASTGRVVRRNGTRYPLPIELGVSDGNVWVTSVENGFVSGAVTRIPFESGRVTQPLVFPSRPVLSLAVGSGTTWALVGPWASLRLAAIDQATGRQRRRHAGLVRRERPRAGDPPDRPRAPPVDRHNRPD